MRLALFLWMFLFDSREPVSAGCVAAAVTAVFTQCANCNQFVYSSKCVIYFCVVQLTFENLFLLAPLLLFYRVAYEWQAICYFFNCGILPFILRHQPLAPAAVFFYEFFFSGFDSAAAGRLRRSASRWTASRERGLSVPPPSYARVDWSSVEKIHQPEPPLSVGFVGRTLGRSHFGLQVWGKGLYLPPSSCLRISWSSLAATTGRRQPVAPSSFKFALPVLLVVHSHTPKKCEQRNT